MDKISRYEEKHICSDEAGCRVQMDDDQFERYEDLLEDLFCLENPEKPRCLKAK